MFITGIPLYFLLRHHYTSFYLLYYSEHEQHLSWVSCILFAPSMTFCYFFSGYLTHIDFHVCSIMSQNGSSKVRDAVKTICISLLLIVIHTNKKIKRNIIIQLNIKVMIVFGHDDRQKSYLAYRNNFGCTCT